MNQSTIDQFNMSMKMVDDNLTRIEILDGEPVLFTGEFKYLELKVPLGVKKILRAPEIRLAGEPLVGSVHGHIKRLSVPETVKYIGEEAFYNCAELEGELELPNVVALGGRAMPRCKITKIIAPKLCHIGIQALKENFMMDSLVASDALNVDNGGLAHCYSLSEVDAKIGSTGPLAFYQCKKLEKIEFSTNIERVMEAKENAVRLGLAEVEHDGMFQLKSAISTCEGLKEIDLGNLEVMRYNIDKSSGLRKITGLKLRQFESKILANQSVLTINGKVLGLEIVLGNINIIVYDPFCERNYELLFTQNKNVNILVDGQHRCIQINVERGQKLTSNELNLLTCDIQ